MEVECLTLPDGKTGVWAFVPRPFAKERTATFVRLVTGLAFGQRILLGCADNYLVIGYTSYHAQKEAQSALRRTYASIT